MTMQAIGICQWPSGLASAGGIASTAFSTNTFDATNDQLAFAFTAKGSFNIKKAYLRTGTLTTAATMRLGAYVLGTDGKPALTPTYWSANGTGATPSGDLLISGANAWQTFTFTNEAIFVAGDQAALVLSYVSGSTPNFQVTGVNANIGNTPGVYADVCYLSNAGGAYSSTFSSISASIVCEDASGNIVYMPSFSPIDATNSTAFSTGATPDERGVKFTVPFKCRVIGIRCAVQMTTAASTLLGALYDSTDQTTTTLAVTPTYDGDLWANTGVFGNVNLYFTTPYTLVAGTTYYATVRNTSANSMKLLDLSMSVTNSINAMPAAGTGTWQLATRTYGAPPTSWSVTTTNYPMISLLIDQIDDGVGGGGGGMMFIPNLEGT